MRITMIVLFLFSIAIASVAVYGDELAMRISLGLQAAVCFSTACLLLVGLVFFGGDEEEVLEE